MKEWALDIVKVLWPDAVSNAELKKSEGRVRWLRTNGKPRTVLDGWAGALTFSSGRRCRSFHVRYHDRLPIRTSALRRGLTDHDGQRRFPAK